MHEIVSFAPPEFSFLPSSAEDSDSRMYGIALKSAYILYFGIASYLS